MAVDQAGRLRGHVWGKKRLTGRGGQNLYQKRISRPVRLGADDCEAPLALCCAGKRKAPERASDARSKRRAREVSPRAPPQSYLFRAVFLRAGLRRAVPVFLAVVFFAAAVLRAGFRRAAVLRAGFRAAVLRAGFRRAVVLRAGFRRAVVLRAAVLRAGFRAAVLRAVFRAGFRAALFRAAGFFLAVVFFAVRFATAIMHPSFGLAGYRSL